MPPRRNLRRVPSPLLEESIIVQSSPDPTDPFVDDSRSQNAPPPEPSSNALPPEPSSFTNIEESKAERVDWSMDMITVLVEFIYEAFKEGKLSDNGMKKELWGQCAIKVNAVSRGQEVHWSKCKNKWGSDIKEKWKHWNILADQSGFGWNEELEKYEAHDYVWASLNKPYPHILWHKTHVMFHRDLIGEILFESQAIGKGAVSGYESRTEPIGEHLIDPRLLEHDQSSTTQSSAKASPAPQFRPKTPYNRSKKRQKEETSDREEDEQLGSRRKADLRKVDIGAALTGLSRQWQLAREEREMHKTVIQQAVHLLEVAYGNRMELMEFIQGCKFFKEEGNAGIFLAITSIEKRDRWLEIELGIELKPL